MAYALTPGDGLPRRAGFAERRDLRLDREREFQRARRHSVRVRTLKFLLPLLATGILSLYALPSMLKTSIDGGRGEASIRGVTLSEGTLKMLEPRIKGVNDKGDAYDFIANSGTQASKDADVLYLENIRGNVFGHDGKITTLTAPNGVHYNKADEMVFNNGAVVTRESGMTAIFQTATAYMKQQIVVSKTPVVVRLHQSTIHADSMTLFWGDQRAIFEGNVKTHAERQPVATDASAQPMPLPAGDGSKAAEPRAP